MTYREMIERVAVLRGRRPLIVEVPVLSPRLSSLWLQLVTPAEASVARPLVEGLRNPTVAQEERIRAAGSVRAHLVRRGCAPGSAPQQADAAAQCWSFAHAASRPR